MRALEIVHQVEGQFEDNAITPQLGEQISNNSN